MKDKKISAIFFDVNETLVDVAILDDLFERFCNQRLAKDWFDQLILLSFEYTIFNRYVPFTDLAKTSLSMIESRHKISLNESQKQEILSSYMKFPAHPDVRESLQKLKQTKIPMYTFTNSPLKAIEGQLNNSNILEYFDAMISVDEVKKLKPAKEVYDHAVKVANIPKEEALLIAAHDWDTSGAIYAGWQTALLLRKNVVPDPLAPPNRFMHASLSVLCDQIIEQLS